MAEGQFAEYTAVRVTDALRQGDVIEAVDLQTSKWQSKLLVITADCDFANKKHQGRVTCVPLLDQDDYLLGFPVEKIRNESIGKFTIDLQRRLKKAMDLEISSKRLREWPIEQDPEVIMRQLKVSQNDSRDIESLFSAIALLSGEMKDLESALETIIQAQACIPNAKKESNVRSELRNRITQNYTNPPGDAIFLSAIAPSHENGYFAYLRHLEQINQNEIQTAPSRTKNAYRRIGRLRDRYTHALVQRFAMVFMSIGLPSDYEETRDLHSALKGELI